MLNPNGGIAKTPMSLQQQHDSEVNAVRNAAWKQQVFVVNYIFLGRFDEIEIILRINFLCGYLLRSDHFALTDLPTCWCPSLCQYWKKMCVALVIWKTVCGRQKQGERDREDISFAPLFIGKIQLHGLAPVGREQETERQSEWERDWMKLIYSSEPISN